MTWPVEHGGGGRPPIDRLIVGEELIAAGAPIAAMWFADRQMGPTLIAYGTARPAGRRSCPGSCRARPRGASACPSPTPAPTWPRCKTRARPRRRRVRDQRAEDLDQLRRGRRLLLPDLPHVHRRPAARRASARSSCRWTRPGIEVRPITDMTTNRHFCEVFYTDVRVPVDNLVGVEGGGVQADDAPARARARRHRPAGVEPRAVQDGRRAAPTRPTRSSARRSPRSRSATASAGSWSIREVLGQAPQGFLGGHEVLLHRARVARRRVRRVACSAPRRRCGATSRTGCCYAPGLHDHGRHVEHHAQHPRRARPRPAPRTALNARRGRFGHARPTATR